MKAILAVILFCGLSFTHLRADAPSFIITTAATTWADGASEPAGEVELLVAETPEGFTILCAGTKYTIPRANARRLGGDEAAMALLAQRQNLYVQLDAASTAQPGTQPARPTQYSGRKLPRNWIPPEQADANFAAEQLRKQAARQADEVERLRQELQKKR